MEQIRRLSYREGVRLDQRRLEELYHRLGAAGAEEFVCRALEEIAVRLTYAEKLYRRGELAELRKCLRALTASAERIGMVALSRVAGDVRGCIDRGRCGGHRGHAVAAGAHRRGLAVGDLGPAGIHHLAGQGRLGPCRCAPEG